LFYVIPSKAFDILAIVKAPHKNPALEHRSAFENVHPISIKFLGKESGSRITYTRTKTSFTANIHTMDASGYLKKHGWQGSGHSLDGNGRGLKKPLLVSKKVDVLGVGLNKHAAVSDQWWLRAYDQGLQALGTGKESALAQAQKHGVNRGGLYGRFVKGEGVPGTLGQDIWPSTKPGEVPVVTEEVKKVAENSMLPTPQDSDAQEEKAERKRKRADKSEEKKSKRKAESGKEDSEEKAAKKAKKEAKKVAKAAKGKTSGTSTADASGAEEELDSEKRALYTKRAAEKGVSLEAYIKRRQEKYSAKKDEKRK
jgi:nucleolar protein TMA23